MLTTYGMIVIATTLLSSFVAMTSVVLFALHLTKYYIKLRMVISMMHEVAPKKELRQEAIRIEQVSHRILKSGCVVEMKDILKNLNGPTHREFSKMIDFVARANLFLNFAIIMGFIIFFMGCIFMAISFIFNIKIVV